MPIYEYKCEKDGVFQDIRKVEDRGKEFLCPKCGRELNLILSSFGHRMSGVVNVPKSLDMQVGKMAEEGWKSYEEKRKERRSKK